MFYLEEDCSIEELQAAYERQVRRNSNDLSLVKEIDKAYHKIYEEKIALKHAEQPKDSTGKFSVKYFDRPTLHSNA